MSKLGVWFRRLWSAAKKTSPIWLTVTASGGVILSAYSSSQDTKRYLQEIEKLGPNGLDDLTPKEKWKLRLRCYAPTIGCAAGTIGCMAGATTIGQKQTAAAVAAWGASARLAEELQKKINEEVGEKKAKEIFDKIAQDDIDQRPMDPQKIVVTGQGDVPVRDLVFGTDFYSSMNKLEQAVNNVNKILYGDIGMECTLNEFRFMLGLEPVNSGYSLGWTPENGLEIRYSTCLDAQNRPCITIQYDIYPLVPTATGRGVSIC